MEGLREEFLRRYSKKDRNCDYRYENTSSYMRSNSTAMQILSNIYEEYKSELNMHYDEFIDEIFYVRPWNYNNKRKFLYNWEIVRGNGYKKKPHHEKKMLSEDDKRKREWRKKQKRDSKRNRKVVRWSKMIRDENDRSLRRWTRSRLSSGDYDLEKGWRKYNA